MDMPDTREQIEKRLARGEAYMEEHPEDKNASELYWKLWEQNIKMGEAEEDAEYLRGKLAVNTSRQEALL
jgi:ribulose bisphosphate carboxylase small subunit